MTPQIIIEEKLEPVEGHESLVNYKFFVYSGVTKIVQVHSSASGRGCVTFYNNEGKRLKIRKWVSEVEGALPEIDTGLTLSGQFATMLDAAEQIGSGLDHVRVDLYEARNGIFLSELTCYDGSGYSYLFEELEVYEVRPSEKLNLEYGGFWDLPEISLGKKVLRAMFSSL